MDYIELLTQFVDCKTQPVEQHVGQSFPQHELRFVLEGDQPESELRGALSLLLGSSFLLTPLFTQQALKRFFVLAFPGVERTMGEREMFAISYALADTLGLISVEPDLGSGFNSVRGDAISLGNTEAALGALPICTVTATAPPDRRWTHARAGIPGAWQLTRGQGVLIGLLDTGVAPHDQISSSSLLLSAGRDLIDGDLDPTDPLSADAGHPGHGTAVGSVIVGLDTPAMSGIAPEAVLVPIRCIEDVRVFNQAPVAAGIAHATEVGCHIISLSLGGLPSKSMHAAIQRAIAEDIIVIAAAGNCVATVVWPARYEEVIAVAATNISDVPWRGSCNGAAVDIAAPGELVWLARREPGNHTTSTVEAGQGTSYAVAIVSGIAALWLSHHGRAAVIAEARTRGVSVQALFKRALQASARRPEKWNPRRFGPGIVDATKLVSMALPEIPQVQQAGAHAAGEGTRSWLAEEMGAGVADASFKWDRFGAELANILLKQSQIGGTLYEMSAIAKVSGTRSSPQLAEAVAKSNNQFLARFGEVPGTTSVSRPFVRATPQVDLPRLKKAMAIKGTGLESTPNLDVAAIGSYLMGPGHKEQLDRLARILDASKSNDSALKTKIHDHAAAALREITAGETLSSVGVVGLEALILLAGRPALRTINGDVNLADPRASEWAVALGLAMTHGKLRDRIGKVGRIDLDGIHCGTGFVCGEGLVMTNRHVAQILAAPKPSRNNQEAWVFNSSDVTIDFADSPDPAVTTNRFIIEEIVGAGPREIDPFRLDFSFLDAAVLRVQTKNAAGTSLPSPMELVSGQTKASFGKTFFAIGYPSKPTHLPVNDKNEFDMNVLNRLSELFDQYNDRYLSPGEIIAAATGTVADSQFWTLQHDATTLEGSSGSCLLHPDNPMGIVGLHFGGSWQKRNYAHSMSVLRQQNTFLSSLALRWV